MRTSDISAQRCRSMDVRCHLKKNAAKLLLIFVVSAVAFADTAPPTRVEAVTEMIHGVPITDPYRWLEDQDSPATRAWINAQAQHTRSRLDRLPDRAAIQKA